MSEKIKIYAPYNSNVNTAGAGAPVYDKDIILK